MVIPAYAGMIPNAPYIEEFKKSYTRIRGDDPETEKATKIAVKLYPHTRG